MMVHYSTTPRKFNIAPENGWLEGGHFQGDSKDSPCNICMNEVSIRRNPIIEL